MPSFHSLSEYPTSDIAGIAFIPPALIRLAQARVANPIVFLEVYARQKEVTSYVEEIGALSALPLSTDELPLVSRTTSVFLFSTRPWTGSPTEISRPNIRAAPRVMSAGKITRTIPIEAAVIQRGQRTIGDAEIANPDGDYDAMIRDNSLEGEIIQAWLGEPQDSSDDWALLYQATIDRVEATRKSIRFGITTIADELERPLQLSRYTGGGGLSGDSAVAGRLKPTAWGECWGVAPVLISTADNIYQVHDRTIQAIDWVREGGLDYDFTEDFPDFEALAGATLYLGEYATCLTHGLFRVGISLDGLVHPLRVGLQGDNASPGYVSATGDILYRIARNRAFLAAVQIDIDSFNALPRGRVGFSTDGSSDVSCSIVFDRLLRALIATYGVSRGEKLRIQRLLPAEFQTDTVSVRIDQTFDQSVQPRPYTPRHTQPYGYAPTAAPVGEDDVFPDADESVRRRLIEGGLFDSVTETSELSVVPIPQPVLPTYFVEQDPAEQMAIASLAFATRNQTALRVELGRQGLLADLGSVVAIDGARFDPDFRGVVYQQEDDLGAIVTSAVVSLG